MTLKSIFMIKNFLRILLVIISLFNITFAFADLKNIQQRGTLRIGVTGDYRPFSWFDPNTQQFSGLDINLAKELAIYLHVRPVFVKTTWPTLNADLQADKFDIAMGGVSISPQRQILFSFSKPYLFDNKVAVIRCIDNNKFSNTYKLNSPEVRIIENKGGTNEIFAKNNLKQSALEIVPSNNGIFDQILQHNVDAMITDHTEAIFQKKLHPELCIVTFDPKISPLIAKVIMMQKNASDLQNSVNNWLGKMQSSKKLVKIINQWLG
jgi:cyclohexadienyl dehydratase